MANEADNRESIDSIQRADHVAASDTEKGEVNEQYEQPQQRGERPQHSHEPTETMKTDSRTPENVVVAAGISVGVHAPPNSAATPQRPSERSGPRHEQLSPREDEQQSTYRSESVLARHSTSPASTSSNVATPAGGDTASPYRAVYHREHNWLTGTGRSIDSGAPSEGEGSAFSGTLDSLRGFASRARDSVVRVAHGDFSDIRRAGQSIQRVGTGDFSELAGVERYLAGAFDECAAFGEKFCPCMGPETGQSSVGRAPAGPPPIMMLVDTPGGPYIRLIPDALVEESVRQGLLSAAEVEHQRQGATCAVVSPEN